MQHQPSIETSNRASQSVSPSSSMEIAPCNPFTTSSSSVELKGRNGEQTYSLRTSTELLKVLNRVWSLEEQHVSDMSLIKALKKELDHARFRAIELAREQLGGRHELMEHLTGGKLVRKNKAKVQSTRDELEHERKLRKQSESLERELAQELYEVKLSVATVSRELEKERMSRGFLEDLCDELAKGVRDCDQRQKSDKDLGERDDHDHLLLRISKAWLDERMQAKQQNSTIQNERNSKAKINGNLMLGNPMYKKSSLESLPLNLGASARREEDDDDDGSSSSHSTCLEVEKSSGYSLKPQGQKFLENHFEEMLKENLESSDRTRALSPSRLQAKFEEHMAQAMSYGEIGISQKAEAVENNTSDDKGKSEGMSKQLLIRNYYPFSENGLPVSKDHATASSSARSSQSPVCKWTQKLAARDRDTSETVPVKFLTELKESSVSEKLFEARSRGQKSRSCQKASIYPSGDE